MSRANAKISKLIENAGGVFQAILDSEISGSRFKAFKLYVNGKLLSAPRDRISVVILLTEQQFFEEVVAEEIPDVIKPNVNYVYNEKVAIEAFERTSNEFNLGNRVRDAFIANLQNGARV